RAHPARVGVAPAAVVTALPASARPSGSKPAAPVPAAPARAATIDAVAGAPTVEALKSALAAGALRDETALTIRPAAVWAGAAATDAWRALLASPDLAGIEELHVEARLTRGALGELVACPTLGNLRALTFLLTGI